MMDYIAIIGRKYPGCQVSCNGDPLSYEDINWEGGDPIPTEDQLQADRLECLREDIWSGIKAERDRRGEENGTPVGDKWFHSDQTSKIQQVALKVASEQGMIPPNLHWKTMDGTFVTMTNQLALQIFVGAMLKSTEIFAAAERHRATMLAQADPTNYDYSTGWPQTFAEYQASLGM
jgi:hypothetical protein